MGIETKRSVSLDSMREPAVGRRSGDTADSLTFLNRIQKLNEGVYVQKSGFYWEKEREPSETKTLK